MISFTQGTLIISNIILIFLVIIYGYLIVEKKQKEESGIWIYFLIACALFFLSQLVDFFSQLLILDASIVKTGLQLLFVIVMLLGFITKYSSISSKKK